MKTRAYFDRVHRKAKEDGFEPVWVVYEDPPSYPGKYVARLLLLNNENLEVLSGIEWDDTLFTVQIVEDTLRKTRDLLPNGMFQMNRKPNDDACIVEVWL